MAVHEAEREKVLPQITSLMSFIAFLLCTILPYVVAHPLIAFVNLLVLIWTSIFVGKKVEAKLTPKNPGEIICQQMCAKICKKINDVNCNGTCYEICCEFLAKSK
jgi:divalent metal cation (Fe/Co/Zn/Cd) transporter